MDITPQEKFSTCEASSCLQNNTVTCVAADILKKSCPHPLTKHL